MVTQFITNWMQREPYRLAALAEVIPFGWKIPTVRETAVGRNCALFDAFDAVSQVHPTMPGMICSRSQWQSINSSPYRLSVCQRSEA